MKKEEALKMIEAERSNFLSSIRRRVYGAEQEDIFNETWIVFNRNWKDSFDRPVQFFYLLLKQQIQNFIAARTRGNRAIASLYTVEESSYDPTPNLDARQSLDILLPTIEQLAKEMLSFKILKAFAIDGKSYKEIQEEFTLSSGYVGKLIAEAREHLKKQFK